MHLVMLLKAHGFRQPERPTRSRRSPGFQDIGLYVQSMLWRTTPVTWVGVLLCAAGLWRAGHQRKLVLLTLALTGALFVLLFGVASGRNSAHYVMFAYAAADILAGAGFVWAATWIGARIGSGGGPALAAAIATGAVVSQALSAAAFFPYYFNYFSPVMEAAEAGRQNPNFGYGEGLDLAAAYLQAKPEAADATSMAFYGRGPFSYFYGGRTEPLKTVYAGCGECPAAAATSAQDGLPGDLLRHSAGTSSAAQRHAGAGGHDAGEDDLAQRHRVRANLQHGDDAAGVPRAAGAMISGCRCRS